MFVPSDEVVAEAVGMLEVSEEKDSESARREAPAILVALDTRSWKFSWLCLVLISFLFLRVAWRASKPPILLPTAVSSVTAGCVDVGEEIIPLASERELGDFDV